MKQHIQKRNELGERDGSQLLPFMKRTARETECPKDEAFISMTHLFLLTRLQEAEELLAA
jgi:hypothetical protein